MTNEQIITKYLEGVAQAIKNDAAAKGQRIPSGFEVVKQDGNIALVAPDHFQYLVFGRGPGKMPPVENILNWVKKTGIQGRDDLGRFITDKSLAFAVAKKIAREGTDIFQGKRPGIDLLGALNVGLEGMLNDVGENEALEFTTLLAKDISDGPNR